MQISYTQNFDDCKKNIMLIYNIDINGCQKDISLYIKDGLQYKGYLYAWMAKAIQIKQNM